MAKLILLARYSPRPLPPRPTIEQQLAYDEDRAKNSCDVQLEDLREWAFKNGHEIVQEFREDALSGDTSEERPTLTEALAACRRGYWLVVRDFQRVSRVHQFLMYTAADLASRGVKLVSPTEGEYKHDDDELWLTFGIKSLMGEYHRRTTKKRTKRKVLRYQNEDRLRMSERLPYGYRAEEGGELAKGGVLSKRMVEDPDEQAIVKRMLELHQAGMKYREIGRTLIAEGMRPRSGSNEWRHGTIKGVIERETPVPR